MAGGKIFIAIGFGIEIRIGFSKTFDSDPDSDPDALHGTELSNAEYKAVQKQRVCNLMTGADMKKNIAHKRANSTGMLRCLLAAGMMFMIAVSVPLYAADAGSGVKGATMDAVKNSNIGKKFPVVNAKTLAGKKTTVPDDAAGKVTLVCVAFLRESQSQLDSWLNPFYEKFGSRDDIMFYEVPMISGGYKFMKLIIDGGMRGGLPEFKHKHVVTMYGDVESYMQVLNLDPRNGHAFLLDREGIIRWQNEGFSNAETLASLFAATEVLVQQ